MPGALDGHSIAALLAKSASQWANSYTEQRYKQKFSIVPGRGSASDKVATIRQAEREPKSSKNGYTPNCHQPAISGFACV
jgi:hypothetical protein